MIGWLVIVRRQAKRRNTPAGAGDKTGPRVAVWQGPVDCRHWLDELVATGDAIALGGNGYPDRLTAQARAILPTVMAGPPYAHEVWLCGPDDILLDGWEGRTVIDAEVDEVDPLEWLIVDIWDES
jgi:hypothetical protein